MIGRTVSHYKIVEKLGEGGMGVVYKAQDLNLDRHVALKFLPADLTNNEQAKKRFIHEAKAASALDHPNVCTVHEIGETEDKQLFIAMACYEGESLRERIARGRLPIAEAVDIAQQIAEGLAKAHGQGIAHRDVKPANIFITTDGLVKIVDFGLAKLSGSSRMTRTGTTVGTVAYMAPEQCLGEDTDHRTDVWSLGVTLYEMISGELPFRGDREPAMAYSILNEEPTSISTRIPDVPRRIEEIVVRALEKRPDDRFQDASAVAEALRETLPLLTGESTAPRGGRVLSRRARRKRRLIAAGVAGVVAVAAFLVVNRFAVEKAEGAPAIAVVPLTRFAGDDESEQMTRMVARMLTTDLGESSHIRVLGAAGLHQILRNRRLDETSNFTTEDFFNIARSANLSHIVTLSLFRGGNSARADIEILDMSDGHSLATASQETDGVDNLVQMIDPLATRTREALLSGDQLASEQDRPFGDITSKSAAAVVFYYRAQEFEEQANSARAVALYDKALELDPDFLLAKLLRGQLVEGNISWVEAEDTQRLSDYERLMLKGFETFAKGDFPTMLQVANEMLASRPGNWDGVNLKYIAEYFLGHYEDAVRSCEEAIRNGYRTYYEHLFLNSSYAMSGLDAKEMSRRYLVLLDEDPSDSMLKFWLAITYLILNKDDEAEELLDFVFDVYPGNDTLLKVLSNTFAWRESPNKSADYDRALAHIEKVRELRIAHSRNEGTLPEDLSTFDVLLGGVPLSFMIGEVYWLRGELDKAIEAYKLSLNTIDYYNSFYRLGLAYEQSGRADEAVANFGRYIDVTDLSWYDASAAGREDGCAATPVCHAISRPVALNDAKRRIEQLK